MRSYSRVLRAGGSAGGGNLSALFAKISARVQELNGGVGPRRCPGDGDEARKIAPCPRWQSAGGPGVSHEEQKSACIACTRCEGLAPAEPTPDDVRLEATLRHIEHLILEQKAGRQFSLSELSALEWRGIVAWHTAQDGYDRAHQARVARMFDLLVQKLSTHR